MTINADDLDHLKEIINNQIEASTKKMLVYLNTYIKIVEQDLKEKQEKYLQGSSGWIKDLDKQMFYIKEALRDKDIEFIDMMEKKDD